MDGRPYRFLVRETSSHWDEKDPELLITVQREEEDPGRVLQFRLNYGTSVTPALVQSIVRQAFQAGWDPAGRGNAFQLTNFAV